MDSYQIYLVAILLGVLVGVTEIVSRYPDDPARALKTIPAFIYLGVNAAAAAFALMSLRLFGEGMVFPNAATDAGSALYQAIGAGLGAMAVLRSSLFQLKIGGSDVPLGPSIIVSTLLQAVDRAVDRAMGDARADIVAEIMKGVVFAKADKVLPSYCFALMQNVTPEEQSSVGMQVDALAADTQFDAEVKSLLLGLTLLNVVGEGLLRTAVENLHGRICD